MEGAAGAAPARLCNQPGSGQERAAPSREVDFWVGAVLPAGGSGERLGTATPKQFCRLLNRPLVSLSLQALNRIPWIKEIVVVVAKQNIELMNSIIERDGGSKVTVVEGAVTRHRSIFNGLKAFIGNQSNRSQLVIPEVVIIHDAVRPFVEEDILFNVAIAAKEYGAAGAVRPLVSTVIATNPAGCLDHSLDRAKYRASEMPQAFKFDIIYKAYQQCTDYDFEYGTECLHLALQYCNTPAKLIDGSPDLWKVTYKRDLFAAESIVKENLSKRVCIITGIKEDAIHLGCLFKEALQMVMKVDMMQWPASKGNHCLQSMASGLHHNFVYVNVNNFDITQDVTQLLEAIENVNLSASYPVVVTVVHLNNPENSTFCVQMEDFNNIKQLANEAIGNDVLVYSLMINCTQDAEKTREDVKRGAAIIESLMKERNPALTGQLFVA